MNSFYYKIKSFSIFVMAIFYIVVGAHHFVDPDWYIQIVPPPFPYKSGIVYFTGIAEIILGSLLFFKTKRILAGWGLIILLIAVYPANIYLALTNGQAMNTTPFIAWSRLPIQFVFIALAYWHTKID